MARIAGKHDTEHALAKLGDAIRARRVSLEMSQETLADAAGIDRSHMGKIERGERNVTLLNLVRIAGALREQLSDVIRAADL